MPFKVISHFQFKPGKADEELRRSGGVLSHLRTQPGFLSYEVVRTGEDRIAVIQAWESEDRFSDAMVAQAGRAASQPPREVIVVSREVHVGEVVLSS